MARKTIEHAADRFSTELGALFKRAFEATGAMDLYDGRPASYMQVIAQTLENQKVKIECLESMSRTIRNIIDGNVK